MGSSLAKMLAEMIDAKSSDMMSYHTNRTSEKPLNKIININFKIAGIREL